MLQGSYEETAVVKFSPYNCTCKKVTVCVGEFRKSALRFVEYSPFGVSCVRLSGIDYIANF